MRECSMMVTVPDGRAIPFCSYHLTDGAGRRVYAALVQRGAEKSMSERIALHEGAMEVSDAVGMTDASAVSHQIRFDEDLCTGCGLCEAFCPMEVIAMEGGAPPRRARGGLLGLRDVLGPVSRARHPHRGNRAGGADDRRAAGAPACRRGARAVPRVGPRAARGAGSALAPGGRLAHSRGGAPARRAPVAEERLRYCQALMAARRGRASS